MSIDDVVEGLGDEFKSIFPLEPIPQSLFNDRFGKDPDCIDASLLFGLAWDRVDSSYWIDFPDAYTALLPRAFVYYLPSMLIAVLEDAENGVFRDFFLGLLDLSADISLMPEFLADRIAHLKPRQATALLDWFDIAKECEVFEDKTTEDRVNLTLLLIEEQVIKWGEEPKS